MTAKATPSRSRDTNLARYVTCVAAVGCLALAYSLYELPAIPRPLEASLFGVVILLAGFCAVKIPRLEVRVTVSDTFVLAFAILFGPGPATLISALECGLLSLRRKDRWERVAFNVTAPALSLWASAHVFFMAGHMQPLALGDAELGRIFVWLAVMTFSWCLLNSALTAVAIALESGAPLLAISKKLSILAVHYGAAASASFCVILVLRYASITAVAGVLPLIFIFHLAIRSWFGRLDDAQHHIDKVNELYLSTVETLATAIEAKDGVTHDHIRRVQRSAIHLARAIGVKDELTIKAIEAAALLHDTGKLAVPEHILNKPGKLSPAEFEKMKLHVDVGADILSAIDFPYPVVPIVRAHHESWDGSGYPNGLKGTEIPIGARILSVVDCFDALTSDRPYRPAMTEGAALQILRERRGTMYDPLVVDTFERVFRDVAPPSESTVHNERALAQISQAAAPVSVTAEAVTTVVYLLRGDEELVAEHATGPLAEALSGVTLRVNERLTGFVAAHKKTIVNSDAALDLAGHDVPPATRTCMSTPLLDEETLVGVMTLYAEAPVTFNEEQGRMLQMLAPQLARMYRRGAATPASAKTELRLVASR